MICASIRLLLQSSGKTLAFPRPPLPSFCTFVTPHSSPPPAAEQQQDSTTILASPLPSSASKLQILKEQGFTEQQIKSLFEGPNKRLFISVSDARISSLLLLLKKHGVPGPASARLVAQCPNVLRLRLLNIQSKIDFFDNICIRDPRLLLKLITHGSGNKSLISLSLRNMERHLVFLRDEIGLDSLGIRRILDKFPSFFALNLERNLRVKLRIFREKGLDNDSISWLWRTYPSILTLSGKGLYERFELLENFGHGIGTKAGLCALGNWSSRSPKTLLSRFESLQRNHGISPSDAIRMVQRYPRLICLTEESIARKIKYLIDVLERNMDEILHYPEYLTYSLHKRIAPRFSIVHQLKSQGSITKAPSLRFVLKMTDAIFSKRFPIHNDDDCHDGNEEAAVVDDGDDGDDGDGDASNDDIHGAMYQP